MRNLGCQYQTFNSFNGSAYKNDVGFMGKIDSSLPHLMESIELEDMIDPGDSD
jgi:hypothetical protein